MSAAHAEKGTAELRAELAGIVAGFSGRVGYGVADLGTGRRLEHAPDTWFPTASAIKLPLLSVVHRLVAAGELAWDQPLTIAAAADPGGSGILQYLGRPRELSLRDTAWLMTCVSDNIATNAILELIGFADAAALLEELAGPGLVLDKPAGATGDEVVPTRSMGRAKPAAALRYLLGLARGEYPGADETVRVAGQQQSRAGIGRYLTLPADADRVAAGEVVTVANKAGALPGVRSDLGLVRRGSSTVALAVFTADGTDRAYGAENEGERCIGEISRAVCRAWLGVPA